MPDSNPSNYANYIGLAAGATRGGAVESFPAHHQTDRRIISTLPAPALHTKEVQFANRDMVGYAS